MPVLSGVPQGTVLGPCLFLIHLMVIADRTSSEVFLSSFADDTRIVRGIENGDDCLSLQADLNNVYSWADEIGMSFNSKKFELLRFWTKREEAPVFSYLAPDNCPIEEKSDLRDLGVRISSDLTFKLQVDLAIQSANQMGGWASRTFRRRSIKLMLVVLKTLINPRLDYCCQLWSPRDQMSINAIEKVQRDFVSQVKDQSLCGANYWEKLSTLGISSQERRRERQQIIFLWKLSQDLIDG